MAYGSVNVPGVSAPDFKTHTDDKANLHAVTKEQVGLGNVDNTSDADKPVSNATQTALNGKANSSHGTHVSFSSTAPKMDGTASAGSASTVARSDHVHPTDTSLAPKVKPMFTKYITVNTLVSTADDANLTDALIVGSGCSGNAQGSVALGYQCKSRDKSYGFAQGFGCTCTGYAGFSQGFKNTVSGETAVAHGNGNTVSGIHAVAFGARNTVEGEDSAAIGLDNSVSANFSYALGRLLLASGRYQTVIGYANKESTAETAKFIIGKGTSDTARANCLRITDTGVYASGNYNASGTDYAELFEWQDGNPEAEDRIGLFVTLDGEKIRLANADDTFILGVISGNPSVVGDVYDDQWQGMYLYDIYGRPLWEDVEIPDKYDEIETVNENGETITERILIEKAHTEHRQKLNPDYDSSQEYQKRTEHKEWGCVGMMGKLVVNDDGTCVVNGWAKPREGGIAVKSDAPTKYRVMSRIDDAHIRILIL